MTLKSVDIARFGARLFPERLGASAGQKVKIKKFQLEILEALTHPFVNITGFRGCAKSTWAAFIYPMAKILLEEEPYTIIYRENQSAARESFDIWKEELESLSATVNISVKTSGELVLLIKHLSTQKISRLRFLTREKKIRGNQAEKGKRPTLIILDDLESYENVDSKAERERTKKIVFGEILKAMDRTRAQFINIGNYIHQDCLVANFEKDARFKSVKISALVEGKSQWEERFSTDSLKEEYRNYKANNMGNLWLMEMQCELIDEETSIFRRSLFNYCSIEEAKEKSRLIYTLCDLAMSEGSRSDYTAFITVGVGEENDIYLLDITAGKWSAKTDRAARELYGVYERFKPLRIGIEGKAGCDGFFYILDSLSKENGIKLPLDEIKASNERDAKYKRIVALDSLFRAGRVFFCEGIEGLEELENQLLTFPRGRHDDFIDALAYIFHYTYGRDFAKKERARISRRPW